MAVKLSRERGQVRSREGQDRTNNRGGSGAVGFQEEVEGGALTSSCPWGPSGDHGSPGR